MKKLLFSSIVLILFSISLAVIQISCSKTNAQTTSRNLLQLNKLVFTRQIPAGSEEIWTADYDGSNQTLVPVALPANFYIDTNAGTESTRLSPDGQTIFFLGNYTTSPGTQSSIYACNIDGSNFRLVIQANAKLMRLEGAY